MTVLIHLSGNWAPTKFTEINGIADNQGNIELLKLTSEMRTHTYVVAQYSSQDILRIEVQV